MPQGGRKKQPFSGKKKKEQLQAKKERQAGRQETDNGERHRSERPGSAATAVKNASGTSSKFFESRPLARDPGKYALIFRTETKEELLKLKEDARKTIYPVEEEYLECQVSDFFTPELHFPVRPPWNYKLTPDALEANERRYFTKYLSGIDEKFESNELSYFELNLETWRQFWRVLEVSDILLCIVDIRFPALLFPPKLYEYCEKELGKHLIVVLNKIDICPAPLVLAWKEYFKTNYPNLETLCFTSFPSYNLHGNLKKEGSLMGQKRRGRLRMCAEGAMELYKVCEKIVQGQVDISGWKQKILDEMTLEDDQEDTEVEVENVDTAKPDTGYHEFKQFEDGRLTIGCLGQPNVGKSSLINAIMGKKVVSVSKTPGHTKHFQTIFLTSNVRLCDCPGLIFPSRVPKALQVLSGSFPIAQLREPYSTVKYLAERMDLPKLLHMTHPEEGETEWCAYDICDGFAKKRGYYTAKAARLDSYRGSNHLLRLALEGRICLCLRPPGFTKDKGKWMKDPRIAEIQHIQAKSGVEEYKPEPLGEISDDDEEEEKGNDESGKVSVRKEKETKRDTDDSDDSGSSEEEEAECFAAQNKFAMLNDDE